MDLNIEQDNTKLKIACFEHNKPIIYIYLKDDTDSQLVCSTCFLKKKLDHDFIIEIDDFLNKNEVHNLIKLFPVLSEESQQYLESESMKNFNMNVLIEKVEKQFDEFADVILSNIEKFKKQLINQITSTENQRLEILKIYNQTAFIEDLKASILKFSDDTKKLNDQLKQIISTKNLCKEEDKNKIEDCLKNHMNLSKLINQSQIENSLESILQKVISTNIQLQDNNKHQSNFMLIQAPSSFLIKERLEIYSIQELKSIPNLFQFQDIITLFESKIGNEEIKELFDKLQECKNLNKIYLDLSDNTIGDQGIDYLCKLISDMNYLTEFGLDLFQDKSVTQVGVKHLCESLQQYSVQIKYLYLNFGDNKNISDQFALTTIIPLYSSCIYLSDLSLNLGYTNIGGNTIRQIANMLKSKSQIKMLLLDISENNIDDESMVYLIDEGLKSLNQQQIQSLKLNLSGNELGDQSVLSLINTISTFSNLEVLDLDLDNIKLGEECIQQLKQFQLTLKDQHCNNLKFNEIYSIYGYWVE